MTEVTSCIFLSAIRQGDTSLVLRLYNKKYGLCSYLLKGARSSSKRRVPFVPLGLYELTAPSYDGNLRVARGIQLMPSPHPPLPDPENTSTSAFIAEVLCRSLWHEPPSEPLFDYLCEVSDIIYSHQYAPEIHIGFLCQLAAYLGVLPSAEPLPYFDLREGLFSANIPPHHDFLDREDALLFRTSIYAHPLGASQYFQNGKERFRTIALWLRYMKTQLEGFGTIRSAEVLAQVFHA